MKKLILLIILTSTGLISACSNFSGHSSIPALQQQQLQTKEMVWQLYRIDGQTLSNQESTHLPYLRFDAANKQVSGSDGCNRIFGSYQIQGNTLHLSPLASTKMMCIDDMQISDQFHLALAKVESFSIEQQTLKLKDQSNHVIMEFHSQSH
ncbi:META domain-containing protein [Acinetobacter sp. MB5]|uniref:META domain-containing protein n=1 Tax=Acinetobacter sp. MB5 TaxID=2069438 RepID=UPI000DD01AAE|nr:META domain-containing protein [Acinetobacter sp. MB5]